MEKTERPPVPHNALVLVGDGRKALFLRNTGTAWHPKLIIERLLHHDNARTRDIGTDKPGRAIAGAGPARNAMEETDWHQLEETRFVHVIADALAAAAHTDAGIQIVVVLPPKALGDLRAGMDKTLKKHVVAEVAQDLTAHPLEEIERHLAIPREEDLLLPKFAR